MSRRLGQAILTPTAPAGPAPAARSAFTYIVLDDPIAAVGTTFAFGIDGAGAVTGDDNDSGGGLRGFVDRGGSYTTLDVPSAIAGGPTFANHGGGGILNARTLTMRGSTVTGNSAPGYFAQQGESVGIFNDGAMTIRDSTILGNVATVGADVYNAGQSFVYDGIIGVLYP